MLPVPDDSRCEDSSLLSGASEYFDPLIGWEADLRTEAERLIYSASSHLTLEVVLEKVLQLSVDSQTQGWTSCLCPLPDHQDCNPSFGYNLQLNIWNCFGCSRRGRPLDLVKYFWNCQSEEEAAERVLAFLKLEILEPVAKQDNTYSQARQKMLTLANQVAQKLRSEPENWDTIENYVSATEKFYKASCKNLNLKALDKCIQVCLQGIGA